MVRIFQALNGSQDSELKHAETDRFRIEYHEGALNYRTNIKKSLPSGFLNPYKGSLSVSLSSQFVHFLHTNPVAKNFYRWSSTTTIAEEVFWSTMIHNLYLKPPGGYPGWFLSTDQKLMCPHFHLLQYCKSA